MLNFRNIASETEGEKNLKLLSDIYERVNGRVNSFLSPDEIEKLKEFIFHVRLIMYYIRKKNITRGESN